MYNLREIHKKFRLVLNVLHKQYKIINNKRNKQKSLNCFKSKLKVIRRDKLILTRTEYIKKGFSAIKRLKVPLDN